MSVDASAVARVLGITTTFKNLRGGAVQFLPQRIALFAQGNSASTYSTDKVRVTSAGQVGELVGFGSEAYLDALELFPANGDGVGSIEVTLYPLEDGYEAVTATGSITPTGTQTEDAEYRVRVAGILSEAFTILTTDTAGLIVDKIVAAVNGVLKMPVIVTDGSTVANFACKWAGPTGNDITLEVIGKDLGVTFTIVQMTGGLVAPDITAALAQIGNVWETMLLLGSVRWNDSTSLDEVQALGEGRWGTTVHKPFVAFYGNTEAVVGTATGTTSGRTDDRITCQLVAPGSVNLPSVVAARQLARIARVANNNPAKGYTAQRATGILPGTDAEQWDFPTRDQAIKAGSSTVEVVDGVVQTSQVVTAWKPSGEEPSAFRFVRNIVKLQNIIYNLSLEFAQDSWAAAPLIPDDQPTVNPDARRASSAVSAIKSMVDNFGLQAWISDTEAAKDSITGEINSSNPNRLDVELTVALSGNSDIVNVGLNFGFFFGEAAEAA